MPLCPIAARHHVLGLPGVGPEHASCRSPKRPLPAPFDLSDCSAWGNAAALTANTVARNPEPLIVSQYDGLLKKQIPRTDPPGYEDVRRNNKLAAPSRGGRSHVYVWGIFHLLDFTRLRPAGDVSFALELRLFLQHALGEVNSQGWPMSCVEFIDLSNHARLVSICTLVTTLPCGKMRRKLTTVPMFATTR